MFVKNAKQSIVACQKLFSRTVPAPAAAQCNSGSARAICGTNFSVIRELQTPQTCSSRFFSTEKRDIDPDHEISHEDFKKAFDNTAITIIDVRLPTELVHVGELPRAINIPLMELQDALQLSPEAFETRFGVKKPRTEDPIVFSCKKGIRSLKAIMFARGLGFSSTRHYNVGFNGYVIEEKRLGGK